MKIMNNLRFKTYIPPVIKATNLYVTEESINLGNDNYILTYYLEPEDVDTKSIDWYYLPKDGNLIITALDDNKISIQRAPTIQPNTTYTLVLQTVDGSNLEDSVSIFIEDTTIYVNNITFSPSSLEIPVGGQGQFAFTVLPSDATNRNIELKVTSAAGGSTNGITVSKESSIVTVQTTDSAELGQYTITGTAQDGSSVSGSCSFTIVKASSSEEEIEEHRSTWRGTDLLSSGHFSDIDEIADAVAAGDFSDIWVGDYFTINGPIFEEATIKTYENYHLVVMDINNLKNSSIYRPVSSNHITLMPEKIIGIASQFQNRAQIYDDNNFIYSTLLPVYWQTYKAILGENHLLSFSDTLPGSESEIDFKFSGVTIPSIRCITNNFNNINVLPMSNAFYNILPGFSLKTEGINKSIANSLAQSMFIKMYIVSDLNNTNGYRIAIMGGKPTSNQSLGNGLTVGVCPLIVFGSEQKS